MDDDCADFIVTPLEEHHPREAFSCDHPDITTYFRERALEDHEAYKVRVKVAIADEDGSTFGFYSLVVGALAPKELPGAIKRKFGNRPIPSVYLAAVAVQSERCRKGIGTALMLDAFETTVKIAKMAGVACITLDAIDEAKAKWYEGRQFERFGQHPDGRIKMFIPLGTVVDALAPSDDTPQTTAS